MHLFGCPIENFTATPGMGPIPGVAFLFLLELHVPCFSCDRVRLSIIQSEFEKGSQAASRGAISRIMARWISAAVVSGRRS
jgi:hypothetical protein